MTKSNRFVIPTILKYEQIDNIFSNRVGSNRARNLLLVYSDHIGLRYSAISRATSKDNLHFAFCFIVYFVFFDSFRINQHSHFNQTDLNIFSAYPSKRIFQNVKSYFALTFIAYYIFVE
jgi:hypothetical protein